MQREWPKSTLESFLKRGGCVGGGRKRLTRADLEAMASEFDIVERYGGAAPTVDEDLHQIRRNVRLGVHVEEWARARGVPLAYARALQRYLEQW
jgi:hypothetical protein